MASAKANLKYFAPVIIWTFFMLYLLLIKVPSPPSGIQLPGLDKIAHLVLFGGFGFFLLGGVVKWQDRTLMASCLALLGVALYGGVTELMQAYFTKHRSGDWLDFLADIVGGILALFFYPVFQGFIKKAPVLQKYFL